MTYCQLILLDLTAHSPTAPAPAPAPGGAGAPAPTSAPGGFGGSFTPRIRFF